MPLSNTLKDSEKRVITEIVEIAERDNCEDEEMLYFHGELEWMTPANPKISVPNESVLDTLVSEGLITERVFHGKQFSSHHYVLTQRGKNAVAANFDFPTMLEEMQGVPQPTSKAPALDFAFVASDDHRVLIERDYEEVRSCFEVSAHKATIVLCGSIVEALLLERLSLEEPKAKSTAANLKTINPKGNLDQWDLYELVKVATEMKVLSSDTESFADQLRGYRNVIHPGYEKRMDFEPTQAKAQAALALLSLIVEALS